MDNSLRLLSCVEMFYHNLGEVKRKHVKVSGGSLQLLIEECHHSITPISGSFVSADEKELRQLSLENKVASVFLSRSSCRLLLASSNCTVDQYRNQNMVPDVNNRVSPA